MQSCCNVLLKLARIIFSRNIYTSVADPLKNDFHTHITRTVGVCLSSKNTLNTRGTRAYLPLACNQLQDLQDDQQYEGLDLGLHQEQPQGLVHRILRLVRIPG